MEAGRPRERLRRLPSVPHPARGAPSHLAPIAQRCSCSAAARPPQLRAARRDHPRSAARDPRARRPRAASAGGTGAGERAARRELARQYEAGGGISFRGFVDELRAAAETAQAAEAPILEEGSDGVRMMTVHKAKGLEFPVVILADPTCKLSRTEAGRWLDPDAQPVRAEARRLGAGGPAPPRRRGSGARQGRSAAPRPTSPPLARAMCWSSRPSAMARTTAAGSTR